jgi:predicted ATPase
LFAERAEAILDSFVLADLDAPLVAAICHKLDGIPLAIELAAALVDTLGIAGLAAQLDDCLSILTHGRRTAQGRHRSLRAVLDGSFDRLPEREQILIARLSAFKSNFSQDAAIASASDAGLGVENVIDGLTNLVAKSLVVNSFAGGSASYRLFETTRAYAMEKLRQSPTATNCSDRTTVALIPQPAGKVGKFHRRAALGHRGFA